MHADDLKELRGRVRGPVLAPTDPTYDETRTIWNAMIDRRPAAIARCLGVADVLACVRFAREKNVTFSIRGGGHNIAGLALVENGLLADLSLMRGVFVDPDARVAHAQPGCLLGDVDRETQLHGLAAVLGFVSTTGIAGLTLGGGFGYLTRQHGWTSDNVVSMTVVTADGRIVRASDAENPDLFWALRGGGGNFGVVIDFAYRLVPVGPEIVGGAIAWRAEDAPAVLAFYRELLATAPRTLVCVAALRLAPPAPWISPEVHGKPIVALFVCHTGSLDDAERDVASIQAFGTPVGDIVGRQTYVSQQSLLDATQPKGRRYYWKSEYVSGLDARLLDALAAHAPHAPSPHSAILLFPVDGALGEHAAEHSAVGNRDAGLVVNVAASWESPAGDEKNVAWAREGWEKMRPFSTGGTYLNFLNEDEGEDRLRAAVGASYERLARIKARWDPENLFRANKNIPPGARENAEAP